MSSLHSRAIRGRARRLAFAATFAMSSAAVISVVPAGASLQPLRLTVAKATIGNLAVVTTVPHSSDLWALNETGSLDNTTYSLVRWHNGHVLSVKAPKIGGRYGGLYAMAAAGPSAIWLAGARQAVGIQELPAIWQWNGKSFVADKLPGDLENGAVAVGSISASSPTNAWAVGSDIWSSKTNEQVALHWNGKTWSEVATPGIGLDEVSTSSPTNAWAIGNGSFWHWAGSSWKAAGAPPAGDNIVSLATTSPQLAYAVGETARDFPLALKWTGKAWAAMVMPKHLHPSFLRSMSMAGSSAFAVGAWSNPSSPLWNPIVLHTSGGAWSVQTEYKPPHGLFLEGVSAASKSRAYAVGYSQAGTGYPGYTFAEAYNGRIWKQISS